MDFEWDRAKELANIRKHGLDFAEAVEALQDETGLTMAEPDCVGEERFVNLGRDAKRRLLVTVFAYRGDRIRIISSRKATARERRQYKQR